jgi:hypothetical protein
MMRERAATGAAAPLEAVAGSALEAPEMASSSSPQLEVPPSPDGREVPRSPDGREVAEMAGVTCPAGERAGGSEGSGDIERATSAALDGLEAAIVANVADERLLLGRLRSLRAARREGRPWRTVLREEAEPTTLSLGGRITTRLAVATRMLRRALALSMLREGATTSEVATHFDVSRQRVSHLVRHRRDGERV